jgi:hypothetical protein
MRNHCTRTGIHDRHKPAETKLTDFWLEVFLQVYYNLDSLSISRVADELVSFTTRHVFAVFHYASRH